jgi:hypothetical protein
VKHVVLTRYDRTKQTEARQAVVYQHDKLCCVGSVGSLVTDPSEAGGARWLQPRGARWPHHPLKESRAVTAATQKKSLHTRVCQTPTSHRPARTASSDRPCSPAP